MEELVIGKNLSWMDGFFPAVHEPEAEYVIKKTRKKPLNKRVRRTNSSRAAAGKTSNTNHHKKEE